MASIIDEQQVNLRYEIKFLTDISRIDFFHNWINMHPYGFRVAYPERRVNNIYFDSFALGSYYGNLAGISERAKLRLRWYGQTYFPEHVVLELKCKKNKLGWKVLEKLPLKGFELENKTSKEIIDFLKHNLQNHQLKLELELKDQIAIYNAYNREYFESFDTEVRLTIDKDLEFSKQFLTNRFTPNIRSFINDLTVIEIKANQSNLESAQEVIKGIPAIPSRFSKYMMGFNGIR